LLVKVEKIKTRGQSKKKTSLRSEGRQAGNSTLPACELDPDKSCVKVSLMAVLEELRDSLSGRSPCHNFMRFESCHARVFLFSYKTPLGHS